ncbi:MAG: penicillin-binding transpeptidase domain-containing protein [Schwartzia sp. (in: firmicutes)]
MGESARDAVTREQRIAAARREQAKINRNYNRVFFFVLFLFFDLTLVYGWYQLVRGEDLAARVRHESGEAEVRQSPRGAILDRNGKELAVSLMMKSLFIDPNNVENKTDVAAKLAPAVGLSEEAILKDIEQGGGFVWVKHFLSTDEVAAVRRLIREEGYNCLGFQDEPRRFYPNDELAAHVLGFVGTDDIGLDGIEQAYDKLIKGEKVETYVQMDNASSRPILDSIFARPKYEGDQCKTIELTIDATMQFMVEEALAEAVQNTNPQAVTAIVMDPKTGEILAMASRPTYNPNRFGEYPAEVWKNRAVSAVYEPGSTFKSIVAAAALQEGVVAPNDWFQDPGFVLVSERRIQNWNGESFGTVTFTDVVKYSLNTGFALVGLDLGAERLSAYAKRFGFGALTGIELPGEEEGILLDPEEMRDSDIATMAIGQSIAVTPLQLVTAMSAIANDGILMKPHMVKSVRNADGSVYEEKRPEEVRRAIETVTDKVLTGLLEQVVAAGGGAKAQVTGYRIAGKTGTAEKVDPNGGGYLSGRYIASFCGFAPVEDPRLTLLVVIDDPSGMYYGGQVAAPVASRIFSQLLRYLHIEPSSDPFVGQRTGEVKPPPAGGTGNRVAVPAVIGLDAAEAALRLREAGLRMEPSGRGVAVAQSWAENSVVPRDTTVVVQFAPPPPDGG